MNPLTFRTIATVEGALANAARTTDVVGMPVRLVAKADETGASSVLFATDRSNLRRQTVYTHLDPVTGRYPLAPRTNQLQVGDPAHALAVDFARTPGIRLPVAGGREANVETVVVNGQLVADPQAASGWRLLVTDARPAVASDFART